MTQSSYRSALVEFCFVCISFCYFWYAERQQQQQQWQRQRCEGLINEANVKRSAPQRRCRRQRRRQLRNAKRWRQKKVAPAFPLLITLLTYTRTHAHRRRKRERERERVNTYACIFLFLIWTFVFSSATFTSPSPCVGLSYPLIYQFIYWFWACLLGFLSKRNCIFFLNISIIYHIII